MSFTMSQFSPTMISFGRRGYNKSGDDEEVQDQGRRGYNRSGRGGYNGPMVLKRGGDDEAEDGRGGYN